MKKRLLLLLTLLLSSSLLHARLTIEITGGVVGGQPIVIVPFAWRGEGELSEDIGQIIHSNLARTGKFSLLERESMIAKPATGKEIDFAAWRLLAIDNIVVGEVVKEGESYLIRFQLFDIHRGKQVSGYSIPTTAEMFRETAHRISDLIYEALIGEPGAFNTQISYVMVNRSKEETIHKLAVADSDGYNEQIILTSKQPLMSPAWSPDGKRLAYVSFEEGRSKIFIQELSSGQREMVAEHEGLNSSPAWSPDGKYLSMTLSKDGNAEIYVLDLKSKKLQRITRSRGIDTESVWMPDGNALLFTSDRGGKPQIYRKMLDSRKRPTGRAQRITFEGGYNARASISPGGERVAMVHQDRGAFRIAVLELKSGNLRVVTQTRLDESPSFSANGAMLIYATELDGNGVLEAVSVDGRVHQRLKLQHGDVREPAWSPLLSK